MLITVLCFATAFMGGMLYKMMRLNVVNRSNPGFDGPGFDGPGLAAVEVERLNAQIKHYEQRLEQRLSAFESELSMFGRDLEIQERQPKPAPSNIEEAVRLARDGVKASTLVRNGFSQAEAELAVGLNAARRRHAKVAS